MECSQITVAQARAQVERCKGIVFDCDGTLVNSMPVHLKAWRESLGHHGIELTDEKFYATAGMAADAMIHLLAKEQAVEGVTVESVMEIRQARLEEALKTVEAVAPVKELLDYALSRGIPVAVASGGEREDVIASLDSAGIDRSVFKVIITAQDVENGKPNPEPFLKAAEGLGVDPQFSLGLEDGNKGLQALKAAGMDSIDVRFLPGYPLPDRFQRT